MKKAQKAYDYLAGLRDKYENGTDFDILNWSVQGLKFFAEYIYGTEKIERILKNTEPEDEYGILDQIIARKESLARGQSKKAEEFVEDDNDVKTTNAQNPFTEKTPQAEKQDIKVVEDVNDVKITEEQIPVIEKSLQEENIDDNKNVKQEKETFVDRLFAKFGLQRIKK